MKRKSRAQAPEAAPDRSLLMAARELTVPIERVKPWDKNPRTTTKKDFNRLKAQIVSLGVYRRLLVFEENGGYTVLGGNTRFRVLQELRAREVAIAIVEPKDDAERLQYCLSDNDHVSTWDDQALAEQLWPRLDLIPLENFRVTLGPSTSLDSIVSAFGPSINLTDEDDVPEPAKEAVTRPGDLFDLGRHKLLCADSTDAASYSRILEGRQADMVFTDPPDNVAYQGTKFDPILGDDQTPEEFLRFSEAFMSRIQEALKPGAALYVCSGYSSYPVFLYALRRAGLIFSTPIVWVKNNTSLGWGDYRHKHEMLLKGKRRPGRKTATPILYGWKEGRHYFPETRFEADVWELDRRASNKMLHPTQKPLGLVARAIRNSSRKDDLILDPFGGSGSTLIAAEKEHRRAALIDLDPIYADVIIRRYAAFTQTPETTIRNTRKQA